jgi:hypothetical protein
MINLWKHNGCYFFVSHTRSLSTDLYVYIVTSLKSTIAVFKSQSLPSSLCTWSHLANHNRRPWAIIVLLLIIES